MEHAQRDYEISRFYGKVQVLILILMEHAQRVLRETLKGSLCCLNPYFNGTCSKSALNPLCLTRKESLNPYFNGTCSKRQAGK